MNFNNFVLIIRSLLEEKKADAFLFQRQDVWMNPFVGPLNALFFEKILGFTGSAGTLLITKTKIILFVDARYVLQAKEEVGDFCEILLENPMDYLRKQKISCLLIDPFMHTLHEFALWNQNNISTAYLPDDFFKIFNFQLQKKGTLRFLNYPEEDGFQQKAQRVFGDLLLESDTFLLCQPEEFCWLLNMRGQDMPYSPIFYGFVLVTYKKNQFHAKVFHYMEMEIKGQEPFVECFLFKNFEDVLKGSFYYDSRQTPLRFFKISGKWSEKKSQIPFLKAQKSSFEQESMRESHLKEGLAIVKFLHWLSERSSGETEFSASMRLEEFRREEESYLGQSFKTISAFEKHSAIIHYHPTLQTNIDLQNGIYLLDAGGQYAFGTTDMTRTVILGRAPTEKEKKIFTIVLQAHIHMASLIFPKGTRGVHLDSAARSFLWQHGLDYPHSTGHGVGCYLNVHEYPPIISSKDDGLVIKEGMIFSNEPGYYLENNFGVRIENLVLVKPYNENLLCLETLTLVPIDMRLIAFEMLSLKQKRFLLDYQHLVYQSLSPYLKDPVKKWLYQETHTDIGI